MPIYEYTCRSCDADFELLIRGGEKPVCPECGERSPTRRLSVPAAHVASSGSLPVCETPQPGTCGRPQCGMGGCQGF